MNSFLHRVIFLILPPLEAASFWLINLHQISIDEVHHAKQFLDEETLTKAQKLIFKEDQSKAIVTHAVLRYFLGQLLKVVPKKITLFRNQYGKPYLQDNPLFFNLSHTKSYAFIGIHSFHPIGVDIEIIRTYPEILKTIEEYLFPAEKTQLASLKNPSDLFSFWCAKEALLKARGTGFIVDQLPLLNYRANSFDGKMSLFTSSDHQIYVYHKEVPNHKLAVCLLNSNS